MRPTHRRLALADSFFHAIWIALALFSTSFKLSAAEFIVSTKNKSPDVAERFRTALGTAQGRGALAGAGTIESQIEIVPTARLVRLPDNSAQPDQLAAVLAEELGLPAGSVQVIPNYIGRLVDETTNDPFFDAALPDLAAAGLPTAWSLRTGSGDLRIAVVDSGIYYRHPDLEFQIARDTSNRIVGANFAGVSQSSDPDADFGLYRKTPERDAAGEVIGCKTTDSVKYWETHGTIVAGIIGAQANNNQFGVGTLWQASIVPIKIADQNCEPLQLTLADVVQGFEFALRSDVKIINASFNVEFTGGETLEQTEVLTNLIDQAAAKGTMIVAAAGNSSVDLDAAPKRGFPFSYAAYPNVIVVGSSAPAGGRPASFSNFGKKSVHVGATGTGVYSTTISATLPVPTLRFSSMSLLNPHTGTSFSAPRVTGILALVMAEWPDGRPEEYKTILEESCVGEPMIVEFACGGTVRADRAITAARNRRQEKARASEGELSAVGSAQATISQALASAAGLPVGQRCESIRAAIPRPAWVNEKEYEEDILGLCGQSIEKLDKDTILSSSTRVVITSKGNISETKVKELLEGRAVVGRISDKELEVAPKAGEPLSAETLQRILGAGGVQVDVRIPAAGQLQRQ